jgi:hypothetical protein
MTEAVMHRVALWSATFALGAVVGCGSPDPGGSPDATVAADVSTGNDASRPGTDVAPRPTDDVASPALDAGPGTDARPVGADAAADARPGTLVLPPADAPFDYQLGGAYSPPAGVRIVTRDRTERPAAGLYNICYLNGFQVQPGEDSTWDPMLILRDAAGRPVIDPDWDEALLDVSTDAKRRAIAAVIAGWIARCATDGYQAVEIDNLDSFSRSGGRLSANDAVATMRLFADAAHARGLPIAQKNSAELVARRAEMATDFVVAEECNRYSECGDYTAAYGDHVLVIEYRRADFDTGCRAFPRLSIVLRDLNLVPAGRPGYVFDGC